MRRDWGLTAWLVDRRPAWSEPVFEALALPGDLVTVVLVLGGLYLLAVWRGSRAESPATPLCADRTAQTIAGILGGLSLIVALESLFAMGRPPQAWHAVTASPYGFPSGHTMAATVCWGALAWWHWPVPTRRRVLGVAVVVGAVGAARLVLGVHYLVDVLAAIGFGVGYLVLVGFVTENRPGRAFGLAIGVAGVAVLLSGIGSRSLIAMSGTVGAAAGWYTLERPRVRQFVREMR